MFTLNRKLKILSEVHTKPVQNAIAMLERDRLMAFLPTEEQGGEIRLVWKEGLGEEEYLFRVTEDAAVILAGDNLGFVYGLLYISEKYLGIKPFWFWMDQQIAKKERVQIPVQEYQPPKPAVRFRGWFFNDEVLMMKWKYNEKDDAGWKMCFEALLRCGGNMTIPGTDKMSRKNRQLAADMGLWITHHHAEPLGAEMFVRAYPDVTPNYLEEQERFYKLWEDAVVEQKDYKVVWNLCFRGQGDAPFWSYDTTGQFDTPEKRGRMISQVIRTQAELVRKYVEKPIFCTNLYGEIMELYKQGFVELDEDVIKVRADNGYGRMVTRRQDNHNPRVEAMPDPEDGGMQGIYYHVSFYDLQAANHITMLPNSVSFVDKELTKVSQNGGNAFWVINCSNVRPHVYYLDAVRKKWFGRSIDDETHSREFAGDYFDGNEQVAECYRAYPRAMTAFGDHEDEHAGEQFYTENVRIMAHSMILGKKEPVQKLSWLTGERPFAEQVKMICKLCCGNLKQLEMLCMKCSRAAETQSAPLFGATLYLQSQIHYCCAAGMELFGEAYMAYLEKDYERAFVLLGRSAECFDDADRKMREAEYGVWENFYFNDCFADVKHTAYMVRKARGYVREVAEGPRHDLWYRKYCYAKEDRDVYLLLVTDNHKTDEELYQIMKDRS